jgi:hypothetical protein
MFSLQVMKKLYPSGKHPFRWAIRLPVVLLLFSSNAVFSQETKSAISNDKTVLVNGKRIFLNGIYYNGKDFTPEQRRADLDLFKAVGMNMIEASQISDWPNINSFFEEAAARNIYLTCEVMFGPNGKGHDFIPKYKNKTAIIGWNTADDSHRQFTVEQMRERNNAIKAIDSNRLTYQTVYKPTISLPYLPTTDMVWPYTYPVWSGVSGADFIDVQNLMDSLTLSYDGCYVAIPQAYDWGTHPRMGKPDYRFPDVKEYRNFVYQYLVYGAKGIVPYSFTDAGRLPKVAPDLWEAIKNATKEINTLKPFFLNGNFKRISTGDKYLQIATWKLKDTYCIIIVNVSNTTTKSVSFGLPVSSKAILKPTFLKQPLGCSINNKTITGTFKPLDVHVYTVESK